MADLIFNGTPAQRQSQMEHFCRKISGDFYGNGRPGTMEQVNGFMTAFHATEAERNRQHKENRARMNLIIALLGLLCTILITLIAVRGFAKTAHIVTSNPTTVSKFDSRR